MDISKLVKPNIRTLKAYQAEEIPCKVKLDANESPYGFRVLKSVMTNEYPDPAAKDLRKLFTRGLRAKYENVLHGNGSDELIYYLITAFGGPVLYPVPTFSMYGIIAQALGARKIEIPLDDRFDIDIRATSRIIKNHGPKLIFLSSPNNPTGNCFSSEKILNIIQQSKGLVVVDEAYQPFSGNNDFLPLLGKHNNLIILRTLSKIGLAGLRVGFMISCVEIINEVNKIRLPFNVNSLSQHVAIESLKNKGQMRAHIRLIVSERKRLLREMNKIKNITVYPSDANFILFNTADADSVYNGLLKKGILIRNMSMAVEGCLRVTVGTPGENTAFLKHLKQVL